MFIKAVQISMVITCMIALVILGIEIYNSLVILYSPFIQYIAMFAMLVATVYAFLWFDKHPMPDREN